LIFLVFLRFLQISRLILLATDQVFSPPCDRPFGTEGAITTFLGSETLNQPWRVIDTSPEAVKRPEAQMNHSIYSADRSTHLKIVVVALVAGITVAGFGISARSGADDSYQSARVIKAGQPVAVTSSATLVR
jgi:hypothetical protein